MINFKKAAHKLKWSEEKFRHLYYELFWVIKEQMKDPDLNTVHLKDFGKFYVKKYTIDNVIKRHIKNIREGKGDADKLRRRIRLLWQARKTKKYNRV